MSKLKTIPANDSDVISIQNMPEYLIFDGVDIDNPISRISVSVAGKERQLIENQNLLTAYMKLGNAGLLGGDVKVGLTYQLALGKLNNQEVEINLTNNTAEPVDVYGFGTKRSGIVRKANTQTVNDGSSAEYKGFDALLFDPENVSQVEVVFAGGYKELLTIDELVALMVKIYPVTDQEGLLGGLIVLKNTGFGNPPFQSVQVYSSGGSTTVLRIGKESV